MIANTFGLLQCSASKIIILVSDAIKRHLGPAHLHLPQDKDEMIPKVSEFELKFGMIQAFGCIDATHIPLKTPKINSHNYFNFKQLYSINVEAVCDYGGCFMPLDWLGTRSKSFCRFKN